MVNTRSTQTSSRKTAPNKHLIKQAILAFQANARLSTANTKTRGEVSGGGRKPWKQKGTGRARVGSSRSPIWVGGGTVFGPTNKRNYKHKLPKKMALKAKAELWQLLKAEDRVISVPELHLAEPKTKLALKLLNESKLKGKTLLITQDIEPELLLATANLPHIEVKPLDQISILDLAFHQTVVMEKICFDKIYGAVGVTSKNANPASKEKSIR